MQLQSCIWTTLGSSLFAIKLNISNIVNLEFVEPVIEAYKYDIKKLPWSLGVHMIFENVSESVDCISYTWTA